MREIKNKHLRDASTFYCKATNCAHNKEAECMAGAISIAGSHATKTSETTCATFIEEGGYGFDNYAEHYDNSKTKISNIKCAASNCKFNEGGECFARNVLINAANASCYTFEIE